MVSTSHSKPNNLRQLAADSWSGVRRHFAVLAGTAAITLMSCGDRTPTRAAGAIKIGEFVPLSGPQAAQGTASHNGTVLAIEHANVNGGVIGKQIALVTENDRAKAGEAAGVVRKLILREGVIALLGEIASSRTIEAAPIAQRHQIPMVSPAATNPSVTKVGNHIFRACFVDPFQGVAMAKFTLHSLKKSRAAVLVDVRQDYSISLARHYREHLITAGGTVVVEEGYRSGDRNFLPQLTSIKASDPEVIFVPGYHEEVALIARQARELGISVPLLGGDAWDSPSLIKVGRRAMENSYFSTHFSTEDPNPLVQEFVRAYTTRFGKEPDSSAALGFDAARVLLDAIRRAGSAEPVKVRDALAATAGFDGVTGMISMDRAGNAVKPAVVLMIRDGRFRYAETVAP